MVKILNELKDVKPFIERVQTAADSERNAFGFLPKDIYRQAAYQGRLYVLVENAEYIGHCLRGGVTPNAKIFQTYIEKKYRGKNHASFLLDYVIKQLEQKCFSDIRVRVADDLEDAKKFYQKMGFCFRGTKKGGKTTNRKINIYLKELNTPKLFSNSNGLSIKRSSLTYQYMLDVNILHDFITDRDFTEDANKIFQAAFNSEIRLCIAQEAIDELSRTSKDITDDSLLKLAQNLPVLFLPSSKELKSLSDKLEKIIFAQRSQNNKLNSNDSSDIRHLATAIFNKVDVFITRDKEILSKSEELDCQFKISVMGSSEFINSMRSDDVVKTATNIEIDGKNLSINPLNNEHQRVHDFLKSEAIDESTIQDVCNPSAEQNSLFVEKNNEIILYASWNKTTDLKPEANIFLFGKTNHDGLELIIRHILDLASKNDSSSQPRLLRIRETKQEKIYPLIRDIAKDEGFLLIANSRDLKKICIDNCITSQNWKKIRLNLEKISDWKLPNNLFDLNSVSELENLFSPALFIMPDNKGIIVPIKKLFSDDLFTKRKSKSHQLSFLSSPEALLYPERVFFCAPQVKSKLQVGHLILFYESKGQGKNKGQGAIIAIARIVNLVLKLEIEKEKEILAKGVVSQEMMQKIGKNKKKLAIYFNNIIELDNPVKFEDLCEMGCNNGTNFVTATSVSHDNILKILQKGLAK